MDKPPDEHRYVPAYDAPLRYWTVVQTLDTLNPLQPDAQSAYKDLLKFERGIKSFADYHFHCMSADYFQAHAAYAMAPPLTGQPVIPPNNGDDGVSVKVNAPYSAWWISGTYASRDECLNILQFLRTDKGKAILRSTAQCVIQRRAPRDPALPSIDLVYRHHGVTE